jgi:hypothetical protein
MNPNNRVLTGLANICGRLVNSGRLTPDDLRKARDLVDEWNVVIDQSGIPSTEPDLKRHIEAHAEDLATRMVGFLESQLFLTLQANA